MKNNLHDSSSGSQRRAFDGVSDLQEFLNHGWFLTLGDQRIVLGWGAANPSLASSTPITLPESCRLYIPEFYPAKDSAVIPATISAPSTHSDIAPGIAPGLASDSAWFTSPCWDVIDREVFVSHVLSGVQAIVNADDQRFQWVEPKQTDFKARWVAIRQGMVSRGVEKAVPVVFAQANGSIDRLRRLDILIRLAILPSSLFPYGFWNECSGIIGATPEILFTKASDQPLETVAVAGTRGKSAGEDTASKLLADPKERREHQLVIDDIKGVLSPLGPLETAETQAVELPSLYHLKTKIFVEVSAAVDFDDVVSRLHPTPALGVAPRHLGFDEILLWDDVSLRGRYGAPFGVSLQFADGTSLQHCLVAIRNIQWHDQEIRLGSGCGIVPESDLEREWQELQLKRESVKQMLGL